MMQNITDYSGDRTRFTARSNQLIRNRNRIIAFKFHK